MKSLIAVAIAASALAANNDYKLEQREIIHHVFANAATLDVNNVNGFITVVGDNSKDIRVDAEKIVRGADDAEVQRGKREVVLDINEKNGIAQLYVNGPFRDNSHSSEDHGFHEHSDRHYEVIYNFTIHVPHATALQLRSVNGAVKADDTTGKFDIHAVNGAITLSQIAGFGAVNAVNGAVAVAFRENPTADTVFETVNGRVDVAFQPSLSADLRFKTVNGHVYTDFDVTPLASAGAIAELNNGRHVLRTNSLQSVRVGSGGPALRFETVNGEIRISKLAR